MAHFLSLSPSSLPPLPHLKLAPKLLHPLPIPPLSKALNSNPNPNRPGRSISASASPEGIGALEKEPAPLTPPSPSPSPEELVGRVFEIPQFFSCESVLLIRFFALGRGGERCDAEGGGEDAACPRGAGARRAGRDQEGEGGPVGVLRNPGRLGVAGEDVDAYLHRTGETLTLCRKSSQFRAFDFLWCLDFYLFLFCLLGWIGEGEVFPSNCCSEI